MRPILAFIAAASALLIGASASAHEVKKGDLTVEHPLVRASLGKAPNTAAYAVVKNVGARSDRLLGASCACAARVELHSHVMRGQVAEMRSVAALPVPAGGQVALAPRGHHLMIFGLKRPLEAGTMVNLTLRFERAGAVTVPFFVTSRVEQELKAHTEGRHEAHAH
jgi:copper(I)-binding protein